MQGRIAKYLAYRAERFNSKVLSLASLEVAHGLFVKVKEIIKEPVQVDIRLTLKPRPYDLRGYVVRRAKCLRPGFDQNSYAEQLTYCRAVGIDDHWPLKVS